MTTQWKKATPTVEIPEDGGDILAPLKRLRAQYEAKSEEMTGKAYGEGAASKLRAARFYIQAAADISLLIEQK